MKPEGILKMFNALKMISKYDNPEKLRKICEKDYSLSYEEAIEMAYENVLWTAQHAIKSLRKPSMTTSND